MPRALLLFLALITTAFAQVPLPATARSPGSLGPMKEVFYMLIAAALFFAALIVWVRFTLRPRKVRKKSPAADVAGDRR